MVRYVSADAPQRRPSFFSDARCLLAWSMLAAGSHRLIDDVDAAIVLDNHACHAVCGRTFPAVRDFAPLNSLIAQAWPGLRGALGRWGIACALLLLLVPCRPPPSRGLSPSAPVPLALLMDCDTMMTLAEASRVCAAAVRGGFWL